MKNQYCIYTLLISVVLSTLIFPVGAAEQITLTFKQIQLASDTKIQGPISDYLVSEKLDGVRGFWDGEKLYSRSGRLIAVPDWFVEHFPEYSIDGELWMGRGTFEQMSSLARRKTPVEVEWEKVKFMIFDLPESPKIFADRYQEAKKQLSDVSVYLAVIEQKQIDDLLKLESWLLQVIAEGGEGLMLHKLSSRYQSGRNRDLIKLKPYFDDEAIVIGYQGGKGKFTGLLGALVVKNKQGITFKLGSGLSMEDRREPPPLGATVTYQYSGLTQKGTPRFARYLRVRFKE